jgi:hypothetical protein
MKHVFSLVAGSLLLVSSAHAQVTFSFGPQVGILRSTLYDASDMPVDFRGRTGLEAGIRSVLQVGHFAFQPSVLYVQRGAQRYDLPPLGGTSGGTRTNTRLDYLHAPLHLAYTQRANGQGLQVFAGPYLGVLLGGRNEETYDNGNERGTGQVVVTTEHTTSFSSFASYMPDYKFYARRLDLGAQAGIGYRLGGALLQLSYSMGLRSLSPTEFYSTNGKTFEADSPNYRNRSVQASLSYLFGAKS